MANSNERQKRTMLKSYEQQLTAARQLMRFQVRKRLEENQDYREPDPSIKRNSNVRLVAKELFTNLLFTGTADSFLDQMRADLGKALGLKLEFTYPPGKSLCLMAREEGGLRYLTKEEWKKLDELDLENFTSQKVDQDMLKNLV